MHTKLAKNGTKFVGTKVTHKKSHEKLDGIDLKSYASHLSNRTRPMKNTGDIQGQSPVISALSEVGSCK